MPEEVLFTFERSMDRRDVADYLRAVADSLEAGDESVTLSPPARPTFGIKAKRETSSSGSPAERSVEFELEWIEGDESGSGELRID